MFNEYWQAFHLLRPWAMLLWLPFCLALLLYVRSTIQSKIQQQKIAAHLACHLTSAPNKAKIFTPIWLTFIIIALFIVILMGPSWKKQSSPFLKDTSALIIALDVSKSMLVTDIQPSRLARAKQKIEDIVKMRQGGFTSLIVYAGSAHVVIPLTNDSRILLEYLSAVSNKIMPNQGKFVENIIPLIEQQNIAQNVPVSVLLVTDASTIDANKKLTRFFANRQEQLLILALGKTAEQLTAQQQNIAPLEDKMLQQLANNTGGSFLKATPDKADVSKLVAKIKGHYVVVNDTQVPWQDAGYFLIFPCLFLYLLWFRKGWKVNWQAYLIILFLLPVSSPPVYAKGIDIKAALVDFWFTADQQGHWYFNQKKYQQAAQAFNNTEWKATSYYLAENFVLAQEYFSRSTSPLARFGVANSLSHQGKYQLAQQHYLAYLQQFPNDNAAVNNLATIKRIISTQTRLSKEQAQKKNKELTKAELLKLKAGLEDSKTKVEQQEKTQQLNANDLLNDKKLNQMWLDNLQQSPADFLANKFKFQSAEQPKENKQQGR